MTQQQHEQHTGALSGRAGRRVPASPSVRCA
jgi:hypothetical protein